jgi:hypothetical protein
MLDEQSQKLSAEKSGSRPNVGPDAYVGPDTKMKERMPRMRPPAQLAAQAGLRDRRSAQPDRRSAQPVVQPEIKDVALDELFSDAPGTMNHNLRGLDFVLKNIIGEENDEAVLEAIRRIKIADSY